MKKIKIKNILFGLGLIGSIAVVSPIITSCGNGASSQVNKPNAGVEKPESSKLANTTFLREYNSEKDHLKVYRVVDKNSDGSYLPNESNERSGMAIFHNFNVIQMDNWPEKAKNDFFYKDQDKFVHSDNVKITGIRPLWGSNAYTDKNGIKSGAIEYKYKVKNYYMDGKLIVDWSEEQAFYYCGFSVK